MAKFLQRLAMATVLVGGVTLLAAGTAQATRPERPAPRARAAARRGFQLFAGANKLSLEVNRFYCGLTDAGNVCTDVTGSPVLGGGSWPRGTPDQYVFNTGIQMAGIIPANAGFAWAGDTVGAWAIDTRGPAEHMQALTGIYNSLNAGDLANWPSAAYANDTSLFHPSLIGRKSISQQDTWMRYWDGAPSLTTGRRHTMGILVEQRSLAWNFPTGNEDLIYFIFRFTNITAKASSGVYAGLKDIGYGAGEIADVGALGDLFQSQSEAAFNVAIPDGGYNISNMFVAFTADMDVGDATNNYASASLPFSLGVTWKSDWRESTWQFPANIFVSPFSTSPGFVGVKYLRSPINPATNKEFGISIFSTYTNPSAANSLFPDPLNVYQGYRYMSGTPGPSTGDNSCQYPVSRHLCFLGQAPSDQRFMESSGPFSLGPGQSSVVVVAYMAAPALLTMPGVPTYNLGPFIGNTNLLPGVVPAGDRLLNPPGPTQDTLRLIDRAMGWRSHADLNANGVIEQPRTVIRNGVTVLSIPKEITVIRGSILDKALVAQGVFDNQFLLPFAPEAPEFYLVPADNRVTVVWRATPTENLGDPYFAVANNVASGQLYDPNFKEFDVEGYRVWRGRSPASMEMIAQFDYKNTVITDFTGAFYNGDYNNAAGVNQCAPELGITASCPVAFATSPPYVNSNDVNLAVLGPNYPGAVQVAASGRVALANGTVLITAADTALTGGGSGFPGLQDTGVPFAFEDNAVRNGYRYFYAVTAFDVNSLASGPSSLSSPLITKAMTPRAPSGQETAGSLGAPQFLRADGSVVPPIPEPSIDPTTGIFSGPMPQTDLILGFAAFVPQLLTGTGVLELFVDTIVAGDPLGSGAPGRLQMRVLSAAGTDTLQVPVNIGQFSSASGTPDYVSSSAFTAAAVDPTQNARFGADPNFALFSKIEFTYPGVWRLAGPSRGDANDDPTRSSFNGPRWWTGAANENTPNPNGGNCAPSAGGCGPPPNPNLTAGALAGVTTLMNIQSYNTVTNAPMRNLEGIASYFYREADFKVYWGAAGTVDSVTDVTHGVVVPFSRQIYASWGILNTAAFGATQPAGVDGNKALLTWADIFCVPPATTIDNAAGNCAPGAGQTSPLFSRTAQLGAVFANGSSYAGTAAAATTGNGFVFYLNGKFFIMQMTALPTAGTVWNARFYTGAVRTSTQTGGTFSWRPSFRPPSIPGLHVRVAYEGTTFMPSVASDTMMRRIHTVPDPYYVTNTSEITANSKVLTFINLPALAIVRIYSASGILVNVLTHNDPTGGGALVWNLRNRNNQFVASGVYFYHVEAPGGLTKIGRFTVVNFAQ
jgi:hypothetical protein